MNRREFFSRSLTKAAKTAMNSLEQQVNIPVRWIRPPFSLPETEFLLGCTRCGACVDACPEQLVFLLNSRSFPPASGTPSLDLSNKACLLCSSWPCVSACEPNVLQQPEQPDVPPVLGVEVNINSQYCLPYLGPECGICASVCPIPGALSWSDQKPSINHENCVGCAQCRAACITTPKAIDLKLKRLIHRNIASDAN